MCAACDRMNYEDDDPVDVNIHDFISVLMVFVFAATLIILFTI